MPCPYISQVLETCKFPLENIVGNIDVIVSQLITNYMARNALLFIIVLEDCYAPPPIGLRKHDCMSLKGVA